MIFTQIALTLVGTYFSSALASVIADLVTRPDKVWSRIAALVWLALTAVGGLASWEISELLLWCITPTIGAVST